MHIQCVQAQHLSTGTRIGQTNLLRWVHRTEQNIFICGNSHTFSVHNEHNWRATRKAPSLMNAGGIALNYYKWHLWITSVLSARFPFQPNLATTTLKPIEQQGTRSCVHVSFIAEVRISLTIWQLYNRKMKMPSNYVHNTYTVACTQTTKTVRTC